MTIYQITAKIPSENNPAVIYNSSLQNNRAYALPDVSLDGECGKAGTLEFTIPYGHPYYSRLTKLTTEIVFTQDNEELFRGRVYEIRTDIETERTVTCEGNLSYLVDSLQPPDRIKGKDTHTVNYDSEDGETSYSKEYSIDKEEGTKETLEAHFRRLVNKHNEQVEAWKQFAVGEITIDEKATEITFDDSSYRTTLDALESDLINLYGGWLRTRRVGNTTYLDWLKDYGTTSSQTFNYGQNIVEFDYTSNAEDMFTILVPIGDDGLTIESVNNGKIGLENAAGIATFGKIYKTESFSGVTDAAKLKSLGEKYMQRNYKDPKRSVSVTAVDMHLIDPSVRAFHLGDKIRLIAPVQGIDETVECLSYTITPNEPENNTYELGDRDETMSQKWTKDVDKSAADAANAARSARTGGGGVGQLFKYMWEEGQNLIANYDNIRLTANKVDATIDDLRVVSGNVAKQATRITQNNEKIELYATKSGIANLGPNETLYSRISVQAGEIASVVRKTGLNNIGENETLFSKITQTESSITSVVQKTGLNSLGENETLFSRITQTESSIQSVVQATGIDGLEPGETLRSKIQQESNRISMVVEDVGGEQKIKAASIVAEINKQTGQSQIKLSADQIDMNGLVRALRTTKLTVDTITAGAVISSGSVTSNASIMAPAIYLGNDNTGVSVGNGLYDVKVEASGNTYTLKALTLADRTNWVDKGTFSRATTLARSWSGGTVTVTATPQGNNLTMGIYSPTNDELTWNGNKVSFEVKTNLDGNETRYGTGKTIEIDAATRYNAGYNAGHNAGYIEGYNDNRTADINVHSANVGPNGEVTVYARVTDYEGTTTNAGEDRKCTIYGPVMTEMANCKANVSQLSTAKLTLYIYEREQYRSVGNYYWYYSTTTGNPVTYYRYDND